MNKNLTNKNLKKENISEYNYWLEQIKKQIYSMQIKSMTFVNSELLTLYWNIGKEIIEKQKEYNWGEKFLLNFSKDLLKEFPNMKGFSVRNLKYIRQWYKFYSNNQIGQQAVAQLKSIPWGHNLVIITKCKKITEAIFYINKTIEYNWSRVVLVHQIENQLYERQGKSITNFKKTLPKPHSELAQQTLKDPYIFDFLNIRKEVEEKELENKLVKNITKFLLELGTGFSFIGRQYHIAVSTEDFYIDLLFYNIELHCYVVIELKTTKFEPGFAGQLNFYVTAVDRQLRKKGDNPTIGLLLCKSKDNLIVEYSLSDIHKPIGVSEYKFKKIMPTKKQLENIVNLENK